MDYFYDGDLASFVLCENCFVNGIETRAVDTHHVGGRKSGGSKLLDIPEKLMAVCRACHDKLENLGFEDQGNIHISFCNMNNIEINEALCKMSLFEMTENFKNGK